MGNFFWWITIVIVFIFGTGLYFLPTIIARKDENFKPIFFLNLLGAWTGLLWIVAMAWALFFKKPTNLSGKDLEQYLLNFIQLKNGKTTAVEIAAETYLSLEQAKYELDKFCSLGIADIEVTDEGDMVYVFNGFLSEKEKNTSKSLLEP